MVARLLVIDQRQRGQAPVLEIFKKCAAAGGDMVDPLDKVEQLDGFTALPAPNDRNRVNIGKRARDRFGPFPKRFVLEFSRRAAPNDRPCPADGSRATLDRPGADVESVPAVGNATLGDPWLRRRTRV